VQVNQNGRFKITWAEAFSDAASAAACASASSTDAGEISISLSMVVSLSDMLSWREKTAKKKAV
jgi:hypothetical protein